MATQSQVAFVTDFGGLNVYPAIDNQIIYPTNTPQKQSTTFTQSNTSNTPMNNSQVPPFSNSQQSTFVYNFTPSTPNTTNNSYSCYCSGCHQKGHNRAKCTNPPCDGSCTKEDCSVKKKRKKEAATAQREENERKNKRRRTKAAQETTGLNGPQFLSAIVGQIKDHIQPKCNNQPPKRKISEISCDDVQSFAVSQSSSSTVDITDDFAEIEEMFEQQPSSPPPIPNLNNDVIAYELERLRKENAEMKQQIQALRESLDCVYSFINNAGKGFAVFADKFKTLKNPCNNQ
ncbi:hypothetical protein C9374_007431 [Naegleria lovaniensis]|uniref:Uncharacterized protein n=1 Tax=Naegleria lovaniensis TaxID=51637 RepID=A0AA88KCM3_NAELO|nr:uncharacterized protein C9374_014691 [Naegleria lovaniensis]XP_044543772.1 uncharacterized protein C9374_010617 [Naegleria lovaniensis]XP_044543947.1 uncharacterized protein C9374_010517 [Naegleria lovaniensis]XP_044546554.1 uncharacterized protein C9374_007431 [Naegleria lovaniensis]KAG2370675.1 hypothetical protein C9374_014691 [Naegleria lovaniensis]KAG2374598.1 hypothetical protein C9374_010617 [Naegleria lovaniensis]KAG2374773.1 hypothetical protein C9374_010517 [Naegleria lovaniensis